MPSEKDLIFKKKKPSRNLSCAFACVIVSELQNIELAGVRVGGGT